MAVIVPFKQTFRSPIDVAYPGAILNPFSKGNGISPWFEMSTLTPASCVIPPIYCPRSIFSSRLNPKKKKIKNWLQGRCYVFSKGKGESEGGGGGGEGEKGDHSLSVRFQSMVEIEIVSILGILGITILWWRLLNFLLTALNKSL